MSKSDILAPIRSPLSDFSKATLVRSLKPDVRAPEAAKPARKDCGALKRYDLVKKTEQNYYFKTVDARKTRTFMISLDSVRCFTYSTSI